MLPRWARRRPRPPAMSAAERRSVRSCTSRASRLSSDPAPNREAISILERASTIDPHHADTWVVLARRYYDDGHYGGGGSNALRKSETAARQALALDPNRTAATVRLFALQVEAGRLQDGYDNALKLVAAAPRQRRSALRPELRPALRRAARGVRPRMRACRLAGPDESHVPQLRAAVHAAGPARSRARFRSPGQRFRMGEDAHAGDLSANGQARRRTRAAPSDGAGRTSAGSRPTATTGCSARCLAGAAPARQGQLSDEDVRAFLTAREDPEPLYFWAGDLAYCGYTAPAITLLRESAPP